jgi:methionine biosynthesis protein MetW
MSVNPLKEHYENLYRKKKAAGYKEEVELRQKDFIHKYFLFFLDPHKNSRHDIVRKNLTPQERYLDIGCWDGSSTVLYRPFEKFQEIYGVDISESAVSEAVNKGIKAHVVDINHEKLPFPDDYFDFITFVAVIEHLIEPYHILHEVKRVLRSQGRLIIGPVNVGSLSNRLRALFGRRPRTSHDNGWDGGHLLYFTPKDLQDLLMKYDFQVVNKFTTGNHQLLRKLFYNLTGEFIFECELKK